MTTFEKLSNLKLKLTNLVYNGLLEKKKNLAVVGLGYVGLPLALEFAKHFRVIGFDINESRVDMMRRGVDPSKELDAEAFKGKDITFTASLHDLRHAHFFVVAVPTPVDEHNVPDLRPVLGASRTIGQVIKKGDYVIFESTVYPGCTEEDCLPVIEQISGLKRGIDFKFGYSPERINPGDKLHTVDKIIKIVSGGDEVSSEEIAKTYGKIITAGVFRAASVRVAEAAKVIENSQRDINIAFMNELSIIFDRMGISTQDVLAAAGTKWNFLKFFPGLVGGHCIGVDPYYLAFKSAQLGYNPQVILAGRRINDEMPGRIAKKLVQTLIQQGKNPGDCRVLVMGMTFKEDVADIRNSKVADLVRELKAYSVEVDITDPHASASEVEHEYGLKMTSKLAKNYDAVLLAVAHQEFKSLGLDHFLSLMPDRPILFDLKGILENNSHSNLIYWRL